MHFGGKLRAICDEYCPFPAQMHSSPLPLSRGKLLQSSGYSISKCLHVGVSSSPHRYVSSFVPTQIYLFLRPHTDIYLPSSPHRYISLSRRPAVPPSRRVCANSCCSPHLALPRNQLSSAAFPIPGLATRAGNKRASANSWTISPSQGKESLSAK
jgi:hypothetical protein